MLLGQYDAATNTTTITTTTCPPCVAKRTEAAVAEAKAGEMEVEVEETEEEKKKREEEEAVARVGRTVGELFEFGVELEGAFCKANANILCSGDESCAVGVAAGGSVRGE